MSTGTDTELDLGTPESKSGEGDGRVVFNDEQKAQVNKLMKARLAREKEAFDSEKATLTETVNQLRTQVDELTRKSQADKSPSEKRASKDELEQLQGQIKQMEEVHKQKVDEFERFKLQAGKLADEKKEAEARVVNIQKEVAITNACRECEFVDPNLILKVTKDLVVWDDSSKRYQVLDDDGNVKLNSAMEPQSLKEFYKEYAANHPFLVTGSVKSGTGSSESKNSSIASSKTITPEQIFGKGSNSALAAKVMKESPARYHALKKQAQDAGLIPA